MPTNVKTPTGLRNSYLGSVVSSACPSLRGIVRLNYWNARHKCKVWHSHSAPLMGLFSPVLIQERGLWIWEHDLLISRSDFVMLSLKTQRSCSNSPCLRLDLLRFCLNRLLAFRYIVACTDFLHSGFSPSPHSWKVCTQISSLLSLCNNPVKIPQLVECQVLTYEMIPVSLRACSLCFLALIGVTL